MRVKKVRVRTQPRAKEMERFASKKFPTETLEVLDVRIAIQATTNHDNTTVEILTGSPPPQFINAVRTIGTKTIKIAEALAQTTAKRVATPKMLHGIMELLKNHHPIEDHIWVQPAGVPIDITGHPNPNHVCEPGKECTAAIVAGHSRETPFHEWINERIRELVIARVRMHMRRQTNPTPKPFTPPPMPDNIHMIHWQGGPAAEA